MVYTTPEEIAENLRSAILHKAQRTPPTDRHKLTLVLDASDLMAHCAPIALERFMTLHSEEVRALGFASIWLSGGFDFLVFRLDLAG